MKRTKLILTALLLWACSGLNAQPAVPSWRQLDQPVENGIWLQPSQAGPAIPLWGFREGIRVGIAPTPGPRGLLRIYTPYMGQDGYKEINFIAMEPLSAGEVHRGLSELEHSGWDDRQGKRFWSGDTSDPNAFPDPTRPAAGVITSDGRRETLSVYIFSEPFDNGAVVYVKLSFHSDRPHEFELTTYAAENSLPLDRFYLSATMGNYARLREFYLRDGSFLKSTELWPDYKGKDFAPHHHVPLEGLIRDSGGGVWLVAYPDETDPQAALYAETTSGNWKYKGVRGVQYWHKSDPLPQLRGTVNGRFCYWGNLSPIPGGISFENFEFEEPFRHGASYIFGVSPLSPKKFIKKIR